MSLKLIEPLRECESSFPSYFRLLRARLWAVRSFTALKYPRDRSHGSISDPRRNMLTPKSLVFKDENTNSQYGLNNSRLTSKQVRDLGTKLGIPENLCYRHPFPGVNEENTFSEALTSESL